MLPFPEDVARALKTLGISHSREANSANVKKRYKQLVATCHPDVPGGSDARMKCVNTAYDVIRQYEEKNGGTLRPEATASTQNPTSAEYYDPHETSLYPPGCDQDTYEAFMQYASQSSRGGPFRRGDFEIHEEAEDIRPPFSKRGRKGQSILRGMGFNVGYDEDFAYEPEGYVNFNDKPETEWQRAFWEMSDGEEEVPDPSLFTSRRQRPERQGMDQGSFFNHVDEFFYNPEDRRRSTQRDKRGKAERGGETPVAGAWNAHEADAFENMFHKEGKSFREIARKLSRPVQEVMEYYNKVSDRKTGTSDQKNGQDRTPTKPQTNSTNRNTSSSSRSTPSDSRSSKLPHGIDEDDMFYSPNRYYGTRGMRQDRRPHTDSKFSYGKQTEEIRRTWSSNRNSDRSNLPFRGRHRQNQSNRKHRNGPYEYDEPDDWV